jgi:glycosyltransferase involved in cell wall biosynthesis
MPPRESRPVRVLFLSHGGGLYGAQQMLLDAVAGLDRHSVVPLLATKPGSPLARACPPDVMVVDAGVLNHWVPIVMHVGAQSRIRYTKGVVEGLFQSVRHLRQIIREHRIDLVYSNTVTVVEGALAARAEGLPHIWHIHEPVRGNDELCPLLPWALYRAIIDRLADRVVVPARTLLPEYRLRRTPVQVIYNGTTIPPLLDKATQRQRVGELLGIEPGSPIVGTVGSLHPRKDHPTFLRAAARLAQRMPSARFIICGRGDPARLAELSSLASSLGIGSAVRLVNDWHGSIHELLAALDVLVVSSIQESFGLTAVEALAVQTPVVATRCGGPEETIQQGETGLLVPVGDPVAMATAIGWLLEHPTQAQAMGAAGRSDVAARFDLSRYAAEIERVIREVAVTRGRK